LPSLKFAIFIHLSHSWWLRQCWSQQHAGRLSHMNSVKWPCSLWVLVDKWIERPPSVQEVMGLIPVGDSDFSLSHACVMLISSLFTEGAIVQVLCC